MKPKLGADYANNYTSCNPIVNYYFNMRLLGAIQICQKIEQRSLSTLSALEIGCFDGRFSHMLSNVHLDVVGMDLNPNFLLSNFLFKHDNNKNVVFCSADAFHLPFKDSSYDVVYGLGVFEHFQPGDKPYEEIYRVLRPRGKLIAGLPIEVGISLLVRKLIQDIIGRGRMSFGDVIKSFSFKEEHGIRWDQDHLDYNWKKTKNQIFKLGMKIICQKYLPFISNCNSWGKPFVIVTAEKPGLDN